MIITLLIVWWGGLLLTAFILSGLCLSQPWPWRRRLAGAVLPILVGVGIPMWDYFPSKWYFEGACRDAGIVLPVKTYSSLSLLNEVRLSITTEALPWKTRRYEITVADRASGEVIGKGRAYSQWAGDEYFLHPLIKVWHFKPWMRRHCPASELEMVNELLKGLVSPGMKEGRHVDE